MNEHKCPTCDGLLKWVGNIFDGHMECPTCKPLSPEERNYVMDGLYKNDLLRRKFEDEQFDAGMMMRRTGRTYEMVMRALGAAILGREVVILTPGPGVTRYIKNMAMDICECPAGQLPVRIIDVRVSPHGLSRDCVVFADHTLYQYKWEASVTKGVEEWGSRYEIKA